MALGVLQDHVDPANDSPSSLVINNATIEMQGTYSCSVVTPKGRSQNDAFLIVIVGMCLPFSPAFVHNVHFILSSFERSLSSFSGILSLFSLFSPMLSSFLSAC